MGSFKIQYKQGLDAGDIEYKDAEFERVAEIFKRYDKYETFNKESKDAIDGLRKDVDMYYDFNAKEAKEYLKRNAKRFAMRLMQNKDEERLAKLLKMNIASNQLLKLLLEEAGEMPTARAYILEMLGNTKTNKSFSI